MIRLFINGGRAQLCGRALTLMRPSRPYRSGDSMPEIERRSLEPVSSEGRRRGRADLAQSLAVGSPTTCVEQAACWHGFKPTSERTDHI